jgi:hypothetical protein
MEVINKTAGASQPRAYGGMPLPGEMTSASAQAPQRRNDTGTWAPDASSEGSLSSCASDQTLPALQLAAVLL